MKTKRTEYSPLFGPKLIEILEFENEYAIKIQHFEHHFAVSTYFRGNYTEELRRFKDKDLMEEYILQVKNYSGFGKPHVRVKKEADKLGDMK